jgi:hypothetical protein
MNVVKGKKCRKRIVCSSSLDRRKLGVRTHSLCLWWFAVFFGAVDVRFGQQMKIFRDIHYGDFKIKCSISPYLWVV